MARRRRGGGGGGRMSIMGRPTGFLAPRVGGNGILAPDILTPGQREKLDAARASGEKPSGGLRRAARMQRQLNKQYRQGFDLNTAGGVINSAFGGANTSGQMQEGFNRLNQTDQFGNQREFYVDPVTGQRGVRDTLGGPQQEQLQGIQGAASGVAGQLQGAYGQPLDLSGAPQVQGINDFAGQRAQIEQGLVQRFNQLNEPTFQKQRAQLDEQFASRGIPIGSELYNKQLRELEDSQNTQRTQFMQQASQLAGGEQERMFQGQLAGRNQYLGEAYQNRALPMQELGGLLSLQQGIPGGQFGPISQINVPGVDVGGIAGQFAGYDVARRGQDIGAASAGAGRYNPVDAIRAQGEEARKTYGFQQGFQQPQYQQQQPGFGDYLGGAIGAGLGAGIGAGFGSYWG